MTEAKRIRANQIFERLRIINTQLNAWSNIKEISRIINCMVEGYSTFQELHTEKIPFDVVKQLVVDAYKKEINELQTEFAAL